MASPSMSVNSGKQVLRDLFVSGLFATVYLTGIVLLSRESLAFEIFISFGVIAVMWVLGMVRPETKRIVILVLIETFFNLNIILAKTGIEFDFPVLNQIAVYGILAYFIIQSLGFLQYQWEQKKIISIFITLIGFGLIFSFYFMLDDASHVVDAEGRFLVWGQEIPWYVITAYCAWAVVVLTVDTKALPYIRQLWFHSISIAIAVLSGEFFHVRLLTACHILFLDTVFNYVTPKTPLSSFLCIPRKWLEFHNKYVKKALSLIVLGIMVFTVVAAWFTLTR